MTSRMCSRPSRACASAFSMTGRVTPPILMSIWSAVIPTRVPATLKSMSPWWSSAPAMSVRTANFVPSMTSPGDSGDRGLHRQSASMSDRAPPQRREAIEESCSIYDVQTPADRKGNSLEGIIGGCLVRLPCPTPGGRGPRRNFTLADAEGREVVMEHEALLRPPIQSMIWASEDAERRRERLSRV